MFICSMHEFRQFVVFSGTALANAEPLQPATYSSLPSFPCMCEYFSVIPVELYCKKSCRDLSFFFRYFKKFHFPKWKMEI